MSNINEKIGVEIRTRRESMGISVELFAGFLGLTRVSVMNIEKGRHSVMPVRMVIICGLFNCQPNDLMGYVEPVKFTIETKEKRVQKIKKVRSIKITKPTK